MNNTDVQEVLSRAVGTFIDPDGGFKEKLEKKVRGEYQKDIVIKFGVDPTRPDIHLGHAVIFRKLRQLQDLGCKVIFLIGDYTAQIGDPSGVSKIRPTLEQAEVEKNMQTFLDQVGKILSLDAKVFSWIRNSDWFTAVTDLGFPPGTKVKIESKDTAGQVSHLEIDANSFPGKAAIFENTRMQRKLSELTYVITLRNFLSTLQKITHSRLIDRDMFQERIKKGEELYLHEMMYPVLQGIDSYVLAQIYGSCDLEVGGTDQTFNMLMGRDIMKTNNTEPQAVLSFEILPGLDGKEKMSKSLDNYIAITDEPNDMYGKVMSVPDSCMLTYFKLATYAPLSEIEKMDADKNPKDLKMRLAREIVAIYHGEEAAKKAEEDFTETFSKGGLPQDLLTVKAAPGEKLSDILLAHKLVESKSEWRRLVGEGAITTAEKGEKIVATDATLDLPLTLRVGKKRFIKIDIL